MDCYAPVQQIREMLERKGFSQTTVVLLGSDVVRSRGKLERARLKFSKAIDVVNEAVGEDALWRRIGKSGWSSERRGNAKSMMPRKPAYHESPLAVC